MRLRETVLTVATGDHSATGLNSVRPTLQLPSTVARIHRVIERRVNATATGPERALRVFEDVPWVPEDRPERVGAGGDEVVPGNLKLGISATQSERFKGENS